MTLTMDQLGSLSGAPSADYKECRSSYPSDTTYGVLTPSDPCWQKLVAWRRSEGRDPLGRDLWGPSGKPADLRPVDEQLGQQDKRDAELMVKRRPRYGPLSRGRRRLPTPAPEPSVVRRQPSAGMSPGMAVAGVLLVAGIGSVLLGAWR